MQLVDTHVHVNFSAFEGDLEATRQRWQAAGVRQLVHSCVSPDEYDRTRSLAEAFPELYFAVGLHPLEAGRWTPHLADELARRVRAGHPKLVAVGETGLDFYKADNRAEQRAAFDGQLAIARAADLPVIIHCRDAADETLALLREFRDRHGIGAARGVMHCWGGTPEEAEGFLELGFYISFSGTVTFKNARPIQETARRVPDDRLLVETDCPFLAPVPRRGKRNEPAYVRHVAEGVAALRGTSPEALADLTARNARRAFGLPDPVGDPEAALAPA